VNEGRMQISEMNMEQKIGTEKRKIQKYDFRRTRRLSKDQRDGLSIVCQSYSKLLYTYFATLFRLSIEVNFVSIDEMKYGEFVESRPVPDCIWTFQTGRSGDLALLNMQAEMILIIVDRLFGGSGRANIAVRPTTAIEKNIMRRVIDRVLKMWDQSWQNFIKVESKQKAYESKPFLVQMVSPTDAVVNIAFNVKIFDEDYLLNICTPLAVLEPLINSVLEKSSSKHREKKGDEKEMQIVKSTVSKAELLLVVYLGKIKMSLRDFSSLEEGDVIRTDQNIHKPLLAIVQNKPKFWVTPGLANNRRAVRIVQACQDEEF